MPVEAAARHGVAQRDCPGRIAAGQRVEAGREAEHVPQRREAGMKAGTVGAFGLT